MAEVVFRKHFFTTLIGIALVISGGAFAQAETMYAVNPIDADTGASHAFTVASLQNGAAEANVSVVGRDILPGSRTLLSGFSAFTDGNGAILDASTTLTLTGAGKTFLPAPVEFFSGMHNVFADPADGITTSKDGGVTSFDDPVPEPATVVLFSLGLAALGVSGRRRPR